MSQLYVFGKEYSRFDVSTIKAHIDSDMIEKAFVVEDDDVNSLDDFAESDEVMKLDWVLQCMLIGIASDQHMNGQKADTLKKWEETGAFTVVLEEYTFGIAKSAPEAKLAWLSIESGESEDW